MKDSAPTSLYKYISSAMFFLHAHLALEHTLIKKEALSEQWSFIAYRVFYMSKVMHPVTRHAFAQNSLKKEGTFIKNNRKFIKFWNVPLTYQ